MDSTVSCSWQAARRSHLLTVQKEERQPKRMMWFRGQSVPILYGRGRKGIFASEDWIARGTIQRIGAIIVATVFILLFGWSLCRQPLNKSSNFGDCGWCFWSDLRNCASRARFLCRVRWDFFDLQASARCGSAVVLQMKPSVRIFPSK